MSVIGLLNWYEEYPAWLSECVASAAKLCDHIIAVDGPYAAFPGAMTKPFSGSEQVDAITHTAAGAGIGCTIHSSRQPWWGGKWGGEVEKRDFMFKLGQTFAKPGDWFLRIDADELLTHVPPGTKQLLANSEYDVAEVTIWEREVNGHIGELVDGNNDYSSPFRCLFRNLPGLRIEQTHFTVVHGEYTVLNGLKQVPAEQLWDVKLEHRTRQRPLGRQRQKNEYNAMINDFEKAEDWH